MDHPIQPEENRWYDIPGFEGLYAIKLLPSVEVKSVARVVERCGNSLRVAERSLKSHTDKGGRLRFTLSKQGIITHLFAHKIIAQIFVPNPLGLDCVRFKDFDVNNHLPYNLEWTTNQDSVCKSANRFKVVERRKKERRQKYADYMNNLEEGNYPAEPRKTTYLYDSRVVLRFWSKIDVPIDRRECWQWLACKDECGYGSIGIGGKLQRAHRLSLEIHLGRLLNKGEQVLHKCDTPGCVNPNHLFIGNPFINSHDKEFKGRGNHSLRGEGIKTSKLSKSTVMVLLRSYFLDHIPQRALAKTHKVSPSLVGAIVRGEAWKHITIPFIHSLKKDQP